MTHPTPDVLALIALDEDVDRAVLDHVGGCRACFAEIEGLQQVVAVGRSLTPQDHLEVPHPRVWQRIARDLHDGRVIPLPGAVALRELVPSVPPARSGPTPLGGTGGSGGGARPSASSTGASPASPRSPRRRRRALLALAAAVLLVVGVGGGFLLRGVLDPAPDVVASTQLNALPTWPGANGTASLEEGPHGQRYLTVTMEMPASLHPSGTMQVWMSDTHAQDMVAMGTMSGLTGRFPVPSSVDLDTHPIVDVSLEPPGDTDPGHSDVSVVRGRLAL